MADAALSLAHSQEVGQHDLAPTREASADAELTDRSGEQLPCSQGAGLNLNLSPEEAMLTGAVLSCPAWHAMSHAVSIDLLLKHSSVNCCFSEHRACRFGLDARMRSGAALPVRDAQQEHRPVGSRCSASRAEPAGSGRARCHVSADAPPVSRRAAAAFCRRSKGCDTADAGGQHAVHCDAR